MTRRTIVALAFAVLANPAQADPLVDRVTDQLAQQGYTRIVVSRTFLGRIRIEATGGNAEREIILNPRTGEILRDYWEAEDAEDAVGLIGTGRRVAGDKTVEDGEDPKMKKMMLKMKRTKQTILLMMRQMTKKRMRRTTRKTTKKTMRRMMKKTTVKMMKARMIDDRLPLSVQTSHGA